MPTPDEARRELARRELERRGSSQVTQKPSQPTNFNVPSPQDMLSQLAPSNVLKQVGVASANAPGATQLLSGSIPGMNPMDIMSGINNLRKDPGQINRAIQRPMQVSQGSPLTQKEKLPAYAGQAAGVGLEMMSPVMGRKGVGIEGKTPFTAGMKKPSTAFPFLFEDAGKEYGSAKTLARKGEDTRETFRLMKMLRSDGGSGRLADEARSVLKSGKDVPVTNLLAYRDALGKMQSEGGVFADDYKVYKDMATEMLRKKSPDLVNKMENMALKYASEGKGNRIPWFTLALDPKVGAIKSATMPGVQNMMGAALSPLVKVPSQVSSLGNAFGGELKSRLKKLLEEERNRQ
jgi:hypothetical protein